MITLGVVVASYPCTIIHRPKGYGISLAVVREQIVMNITSGTVGVREPPDMIVWLISMHRGSCSLNQAMIVDLSSSPNLRFFGSV